MEKKWESYEEVAAFLLNKVKEEFNLKAVEGKQKLIGLTTKTEWEVDAKGILEGSYGIIIIECRRYTTSKQNQEKVASLAYRIQDTKSEGAIIVSPLGLQPGAKKVAEASNIKSIKLDANSTPKIFTLKFLNKIFTGITDGATAGASGTITVMKKCAKCNSSFEQINDEIYCENCKNFQ